MAGKHKASVKSKAAVSQAQGDSVLAGRVLYALGNFRGVAALAAVLLLGVIFSPRSEATGKLMFLTSRLHSDTLFENAEYGILAVGMTLVILTGGIDLSVGSVLGFAATLFSLLMVAYGWSPVPAILVAVLAGALAGSINGFLISRFRIQPFVATLAMMVAARGAAKWISGGIKVQPGARETYALQGSSPQFYTWMTSRVGGIGLEPATLLFIIGIIVMLLIVRYTGFGRRLYAIGGKGKVVELKGLMTSTPGQERHKGFMRGIKGSDLEIIFDADCHWLEPDAQREMRSALARFPEIDAVYGHNDPSAHGAWVSAKLEDKGRERTIKFVGIDSLPTEGIKYVRDGILSATFEYPTGGREAIDVALKILKDEKAPKNITLGTRIFTGDNVDKGGEAL